MSPQDPPNADRPLPDCPIVRPRRGGDSVVIDKSVVEAALDESEHGLVPDVQEYRASDDLLDALADAFDHVTPAMSHDIAADRRAAADAIRWLHDRTVPVYVVRRTR
ncbi:hypothetical protein [Halomarina oriensis]|uniref:Uncharacterized protein n=1 Tax=Halomarina oriensis TaxID=671145 RepID=A0A6B0GK01_9EURY|nr:hypothetical protein [Halomarina oriensis]MWG35246.1 hypothetical protein [Halomarina oriensis]